MRVLYLTFGPLCEQSSHLVYLHYALPILQNRHKITILNLTGDEDVFAAKTFESVKFREFRCEMDGWIINNLQETLLHIKQLVINERVELVILQMEVWELMRELPRVLAGKAVFVTVLHAMPFLGSPILPSDDFETDVIVNAATLKTGFRSLYNLQHYKEAVMVFESGKFITSNRSVDWLIQHYFPKTHTYLIDDYRRRDCSNIPIRKKFDLVYMARMEEGKGVEYFHKILCHLSKNLGRKVSLAILGRTDDEPSQKELQNLIEMSTKSDTYKIIYVGWAGKKEKEYYLGNSSVFVYPSEYDNNPEVIYEAQAFGLPCVLWDLPFSRRSFGRFRSIFLAEHLNIEDMTSKISQVLEDRNTISKMSMDYARKGKTPEEFAGLLENIYLSVITNWP